MRKILSSIMVLALAACSEPATATGEEEWKTVPPKAENTAGRVADLVRDNVKATVQHVKEWWNEDPYAKKPPHTVESTYCYQSLSDVLCYNQPMPGWEGRLVGYQGTFAEPPPPVVTEPLPVVSAEHKNAAERVASVEPVFTAMPEEKEEPAADPAAAEVPPEAEEVQPLATDPNLAPQL